DGVAGNGGDDELHGGTGDDALFQGAGKDTVAGEGGGDLVISSHICGGDQLYGDHTGGDDRFSDNAQFAPLNESGVFVDLESEELGKLTKNGNNKCGKPL